MLSNDEKSTQALNDSPTSNIEEKNSERVQTQPAPAFNPPDGGFKAWSTVVGSWLILFSTFGYTYAFGVFQDYYTRIYITRHSPSSISWIGGFQLAFPFLVGIFSGKLFDAGHFYLLEISGSVIFAFSLFMLSLAKPEHYYQCFLSQGVGMGLGFGLLFVPTLGIQAQHFRRRRALATGIALSGNSVGGVVFPIMLNKLLSKHSFGDSVRVTAYLVLGCLVIGNCLIRTNAPPKSVLSNGKPEGPDVKRFFKDPPYQVILVNAFLASFGLYFPVIYGQLYAVQHNVDSNLSFYFLAILNASSTFGRIIGNYFADIFGPFTMLAPTTLLTGVTIWLVLVIKDRASLVVIAILFGFFSGAYLSLIATGLAFLSKSPREIGARTGIALAVTAIGTLFSAPIQGALLTSRFHWIRPIAFSASFMFAATVTATAIRFILVKERQSQRV